jgi:hypothetical protein
MPLPETCPLCGEPKPPPPPDPIILRAEFVPALSLEMLAAIAAGAELDAEHAIDGKMTIRTRYPVTFRRDPRGRIIETIINRNLPPR